MKILLFLLVAFVADWPQFLGPTRDGVAPGLKPGVKTELLWKNSISTPMMHCARAPNGNFRPRRSKAAKRNAADIA